VAETLGKVDLVIDVDSRAALLGLERVKQSALGTGAEIKAAFAVANAAIAGSSFVFLAKRIADVGIAAESANVRLNSLSGRFKETELAQQAVSVAAKQLNLSQTEAASGFAQLYASLRPTGVGLSDIETIFVGVTAAAKNTGLSAESVNNALIQLTQGLASGRLQGDELRSVLEQLPPLSQAIARELQVPVGSLKQLGSEGKITTDVIIKALDRLKATELGSLDKSLNTSAETLKRFSIALENLQREVSTLFGAETLNAVKLVTAGISDLTTITKAAARAAKDLKENLPEQLQQEQSLRTGSLPVDFLIKTSDVISQGKFSNEIEAFWKKLIGQAKLYGEAKNTALSAGRYIPPEQQAGFVAPGSNRPPRPLIDPAQLKKQQDALKKTFEQGQASIQQAQQQYAETLKLSKLKGDVRDIAAQQLRIDQALAAEAKAYVDAYNAQQGKDPVNAQKLQDAATVSSINLRTAMLEGAKAIKESVENAEQRFKGAASAVKSALDAQDSARVSAFDVITPQAQQETRDRLIGKVQRGINEGQLDPNKISQIYGGDLNKLDIGRLSDLAGKSASLIDAQDNLAKANTALTDATMLLAAVNDQLAAKDWAVNVAVNADGSSAVYGDAVNRAI
jgi:tape measure domain-containing protein